MLGAQKFNKRLREKGCVDRTKSIDGNSWNCWIGVELKVDPDEPDGQLKSES